MGPICFMLGIGRLSTFGHFGVDLESVLGFPGGLLVVVRSACGQPELPEGGGWGLSGRPGFAISRLEAAPAKLMAAKAKARQLKVSPGDMPLHRSNSGPSSADDGDIGQVGCNIYHAGADQSRGEVGQHGANSQAFRMDPKNMFGSLRVVFGQVWAGSGRSRAKLVHITQTRPTFGLPSTKIRTNRFNQLWAGFGQT